MPRKTVAIPVQSPKQEPENPVAVLPPKTEAPSEGTRTDDGKTLNELVVQKVSIPFVSKFKGTTKTEFKDYLRIFVRPDESHDEPDARWDEHESEDEAALKQLFATYGKGSGTEIRVRVEVDGNGEQEFFLDVRYPKPHDDEDAKYPSVLVNPKDEIGDIVLDLFYAMSSEDPPDDFVSRGALEDLVEEQNGDLEEMDPIKRLLDEFDMPGDLPAHLYDLPTRLRSIFRKAKGLSK